MKTEFMYDAENDILGLYAPKAKSHGAIEFGRDIHIDFDTKGNLVGLEFLDASDVLKRVFKLKITKKDLKNILKSFIETEEKKGYLLIKFYLYYLKDAKEQEISDTIVINNPHEPSPIVAKAL